MCHTFPKHFLLLLQLTDRLTPFYNPTCFFTLKALKQPLVSSNKLLFWKLCMLKCCLTLFHKASFFSLSLLRFFKFSLTVWDTLWGEGRNNSITTCHLKCTIWYPCQHRCLSNFEKEKLFLLTLFFAAYWQI